jgi:hypothetical protein
LNTPAHHVPNDLDQLFKLLEQIVAFARGENTLARDDLLMPNDVTNLGVTLGRIRREPPAP